VTARACATACAGPGFRSAGGSGAAKAGAAGDATEAVKLH